MRQYSIFDDDPEHNETCRFPWCGRRFPVGKLKRHVTRCTRVKCAECGEEVRREKFSQHVRQKHQKDSEVRAARSVYSVAQKLNYVEEFLEKTEGDNPVMTPKEFCAKKFPGKRGYVQNIQRWRLQFEAYLPLVFQLAFQIHKPCSSR